MALKSILKKIVRPGDEIRVDHLNGNDYSGKIVDMDYTNPADFTLVLEDKSGDRYIMNIGAGMGVIMVPADYDETKGGDEDEDEEPERLKHEPKTIEEIEKVPVEPKKKKTGKNFKPVHEPVTRTMKRNK